MPTISTALLNTLVLKVYMTDFFLFAQLNLPNVLISVAKKIFSIAIFLPRVLRSQKRQISLLVGFKTATPKTGDWERNRRQETGKRRKNLFFARLGVLN